MSHIFLENMSNKEILDAYNELTGQSLTRFESRRVALKRYTAAVLERNPDAVASSNYSIIWEGASPNLRIGEPHTETPYPEVEPATEKPTTEKPTKAHRHGFVLCIQQHKVLGLP